MGMKEQYSCRKCGSVVTVDANIASDGVDLRVDNGHLRVHGNDLRIECKMCRKHMLTILIKQE